MNDFTKEELKKIFKCIDQLYDLCEAELLDKIQSLIDNYCEHESIDEFDLFMPRVGAILTEEKHSNENKLRLIKDLYLKTVCPDKHKETEDE